MPEAEAPARRRTARRGRRRWVLGALLAVVVLLAVAGFTAWQAVQARDALQQAQGEVRTLQEQLRAVDAEAAAATVERLQRSTERARAMTTGPVWAAAAHLPWLGDDVHAVRVAAQVTDDVAQRAMPQLVEAANSLDPSALSPVDGAVDLAPLQAGLEPLTVAEAELQTAHERVDAVPMDGVIAQVAGPLGQLESSLGEALATTRTARSIAQLLPPMLGAEGPRTYLLMFQNNAEVRATGGLPGALATVQANQGRLTLGEYLPAARLGPFDEPVLPLEGRELPVNGDRPGTYIGDVNFTPHFPDAAQLAAEMWSQRMAQQVDGVVGTDPVALSYLLRATGPVPVPGAEALTSENVVPTLLSDVYERFDEPAEQDLFFAAAAASVFAAVTAGEAEPAAVLTELTRAVDARRLMVWSSSPAEQELLTQTQIGGAFAPDPPGEPTVGVFFNDGTGAKMSYYLDSAVNVVEGACHPDGTQDLAVEVALASTAPADAMTSLPPDVTGERGPTVGRGDLEVGEFRTQVLVYAPTAGGILTATRDGSPAQMLTQEHLGRQVGIFTVDLAPGDKTVLFINLVPVRQSDVAAVTLTPTVTSPIVSTSYRSCH